MQNSASVRIAILFGFFFAAPLCEAQHMHAADAPCQHENSNAEATACFVRASQDEDKLLERVYGVVLSAVDGRVQEALKASQQLWLQYREANCSAERDLYTNGSAAPTVYYACLEAVTRHRTTELKTMYGWRVEKLGKQF